MSRIGRTPITIPPAVQVSLEDNNSLTVKGPKGEISSQFHPDMRIDISENSISVSRPSDEKNHRSLHGLTRTLINNMITGVSTGFSKTLEVNGVGYRAQKQGSSLVLNIGFSHQITVDEIPGISINVPNNNTVVISGIDKQLVGQFAADIRKKRPPEPYKGKGIKYSYEVIRRKEGKTGAKK